MQRREIGGVRQQSPYACVDQRMSSQVRTAVDDAVTNRHRSGHLAEEVLQFRRQQVPGLRGVSICHPFHSSAARCKNDAKVEEPASRTST